MHLLGELFELFLGRLLDGGARRRRRGGLVLDLGEVLEPGLLVAAHVGRRAAVLALDGRARRELAVLAARRAGSGFLLLFFFLGRRGRGSLGRLVGGGLFLVLGLGAGRRGSGLGSGGARLGLGDRLDRRLVGHVGHLDAHLVELLEQVLALGIVRNELDDLVVRM